MNKEWTEKVRQSVISNSNFAELSDEELDDYIVREVDRMFADKRLTVGEKAELVDHVFSSIRDMKRKSMRKRLPSLRKTSCGTLLLRIRRCWRMSISFWETAVLSWNNMKTQWYITGRHWAGTTGIRTITGIM